LQQSFFLFYLFFFQSSEYSVESLFSSCFYVFFCFSDFVYFQLCFWIVFFVFLIYIYNILCIVLFFSGISTSLGILNHKSMYGLGVIHFDRGTPIINQFHRQ
jgi:hypothetical protein